MPGADSARGDATLSRVIGVGGLGFSMVNGIVGVGIFGLPAIAAAMIGPAAIVGYLICVVLFGLVGLCFAEVGSRVPDAGGLYAYVTAAWGPLAGAVAGTMYWTAMGIVPNAAVAIFLADHLANRLPPFAGWAPRAIFLAAFYSVFAALNVRGTRRGADVSIALAVLKLAPLAVLVLAGAFSVEAANLRWTDVPSLSSVGHAAAFIAFAFGGIETGLTASGEVANPASTVPRSLLLALSLVAGLYVGLQLVAQGVLGAGLAAQKAPLVATAEAALGSWGAWMLSATLALSAIGYFAADMLCSPRSMYALAERGQLPRALAAVHPRFGTPAVAIIVYACLSLAIALLGSFRYLAIVSSSATLTLYLAGALGLLRLRAFSVARAGEPFLAPGGSALPLAVAAIIVWMLSSLEWKELLATACVVIVSTAVYSVLFRKGLASFRGQPPALLEEAGGLSR